MPKVPFIPEEAPFSATQRLWLNGFLAGLFAQSGKEDNTSVDDTSIRVVLSVVDPFRQSNRDGKVWPGVSPQRPGVVAFLRRSWKPLLRPGWTGRQNPG